MAKLPKTLGSALALAVALHGSQTQGGKLLREGKLVRREDDNVPLGGTAGKKPRCPQPHHHTVKIPSHHPNLQPQSV